MVRQRVMSSESVDIEFIFTYSPTEWRDVMDSEA